MKEEKIITGLKSRDKKALQALIEQYTAYVGTVIDNISHKALTTEDKEEIASDVFLAVWNNADKLIEGKLKAYAAALARNKTINRLKSAAPFTQSIDDCILTDESCVENEAQRIQDAELLEKLLSILTDEDREIFIRHYFYFQTVEEIGKQMKINRETVKTRLSRGRHKLKLHLEKGMSKQ